MEYCKKSNDFLLIFKQFFCYTMIVDNIIEKNSVFVNRFRAEKLSKERIFKIGEKPSRKA